MYVYTIAASAFETIKIMLLNKSTTDAIWVQNKLLMVLETMFRHGSSKVAVKRCYKTSNSEFQGTQATFIKFAKHMKL